MASLDFPASPSNLDEFTSGDVTWQYNSTKGYWTVINNGVGGPTGFTGSQGTTGFTGSAGVTSIVDNGDATAITIDASENVGIGTTNPSNKFVVSDGDQGIEINPNLGGGGKVHTIYTNRTISPGYVTAQHNALSHEFQISGATQMTLSTSGNVGIGTTSPISLLHLRSGGPAIITLEADVDNITETDNARIEFIQDGGVVSGRVGYANNTNSIEVWNEYTSDIVFGTSDVERMRIYSNGAVEFKNAIVENVYTATAGAIFTLNPDNGTIQNLTLSASCDFNDGLDAGEYITLHILDGTAYTITWPTMEWIGGSAPTLDTTNETIINVWKVGSVLYGALVGVSS